MSPAVWTPDFVAGCVQCSEGDTGTDANYVQAITSATTVTVTHNLGKRPAVTVIDSSLDEVSCDVRHNTINTATLTFSVAFTGTVICN